MNESGVRVLKAKLNLSVQKEKLRTRDFAKLLSVHL